MAIVINGNGIDMGNNPVSNASQIDGVVINEAGSNVATLVEANSYDIGVGQTWQYVTASRSLGVTYTNTTGKPIVLFISFIGIGESNWAYININGSGGIYWTNIYQTGAGGDSIVIPHGSTYEVTSGGIEVKLVYWLELR